MHSEPDTSSLRVVTIRHVEHESAGFIATWARAAMATYREVLPFRGMEIPEEPDCDILVVMGGPMGVYDAHRYAWLSAEKRCIERVMARGAVVLGVCLGAQLIADVLGAPVRKNRVSEIGWFPIRKTEAGLRDRRMDAMPETISVLHWHNDTFDLPAGCLSLYESDGCANQMFISGSNTVALQFHLEATEQSLEQLIAGETATLLPSATVMSAEQMRAHAGLATACNRSLAELLNTLVHQKQSIKSKVKT